MILVFGEILFDMFPGEKRLGGAPFNFAYHLNRLGGDVRFVSRVGDDAPGREILNYLEKRHFPIQDIQVDPHHPTGRVQVKMKKDGSHQFHIEEQVAYDYIEITPALESLLQNEPDLIYTGTLIMRNPANARLIRSIMAKKGAGSLSFCDINLRPACYTPKTVETCLHHAQVLKLSLEELSQIMEMPFIKTFAPAEPRIDSDQNQSARTVEDLRRIMAAYGIDTTILTMGSNGSMWIADGSRFSNPAVSSDPLIDTVGAGDAYAAMAAAGILQGIPHREVMALCEAFAGKICTIRGAVPEQNSFYQEYTGRFFS